MKIKYLAEGKKLVKIVEKGSRVKKEVLAIGNPEKWAKKFGVELYVEPEKKEEKKKKKTTKKTKKVKKNEDK